MLQRRALIMPFPHPVIQISPSYSIKCFCEGAVLHLNREIEHTYNTNCIILMYSLILTSRLSLAHKTNAKMAWCFAGSWRFTAKPKHAKLEMAMYDFLLISTWPLCCCTSPMTWPQPPAPSYWSSKTSPSPSSPSSPGAAMSCPFSPSAPSPWNGCTELTNHE